MLEKSKHVLKHVACMCLKKDAYNREDTIKEVYQGYIDHLKNKQILKFGNGKMSKNVARIDLPEVVTCMANCLGCYAKKQLFEKVIKYRLRNLFIIEHAMTNKKIKKYFYKKIKKELTEHVEDCYKNNLTPCMRWHASGDIYRLEYLHAMLDIAWANPLVLFYTYTKNIHVYMEYKKLKDMGLIPNNFNIVSSIIYNHVNYFDFNNNFYNEIHALEDILKKARKDNIKIYLCNYAMDRIKEDYHKNMLLILLDNFHDVITYNKDTNDHCGQCLACTCYDYVIFIKH